MRLIFAIALFMTPILLASSVTAEESVGVAKITSKPAGATVYVDGRVYGPTPVLIDLKPGRYTVIVSLEGYPPRQKKMLISAGRVTTATIVFSKTDKKGLIRVHNTDVGGNDAGPGTVTLSTDPPGLTVYLNDTVVPKKTPVAFDVDAGAYQLRVEHKGVTVVRKTIFVRAGRLLELDFTVKKRRIIDDEDPWK